MLQRKTKCVIVVSLILLPILINTLACFTLPIEKDVVAGDEGDWIGFFGSYIGVLLGAGVTLYVLWQEGKRNTLHIMIQRQEKYVENLRKDFAKHINGFDFCYLGNIALKINNRSNDTITEFLIELNNKHQHATNLYNSWILSQLENSSCYNDKYETCYNKYIFFITELTELAASFRREEISLKDFMEKLQKFNNDFLKAKDSYLQPLNDASIQILDREVIKKNEMIKELSSWKPNLEKFIDS